MSDPSLPLTMWKVPPSSAARFRLDDIPTLGTQSHHRRPRVADAQRQPVVLEDMNSRDASRTPDLVLSQRPR